MNIDEAIAEVQQSRSAYQLVHFVIGQHDTPEMCFYQLCLELQSLQLKLRVAEINVRKQKVHIARLKETGDELDALEAEEREVELENGIVVQRGAEREYEILVDLFNSCQHFTRDEIDHAQPEYWEKRLTRQTNLQIMSGSVGWAQLDSMRQIGLLDEMVDEREQAIAAQTQMELNS
jgi:hypothetical protein